ncbi:uncharacterized protein LOC130457587 [Monodelphis domestica]|uniref:uncharacterized protein LOC130457587 n=1 Tax=Monodelphis domestica TaxID=13616 RepID=UPI00044340AB|nr:uncharacterized protein LOC130457587 [Monodelphis domestica]
MAKESWWPPAEPEGPAAPRALPGPPPRAPRRGRRRCGAHFNVGGLPSASRWPRPVPSGCSSPPRSGVLRGPPPTTPLCVVSPLGTSQIRGEAPSPPRGDRKVEPVPAQRAPGFSAPLGVPRLSRPSASWEANLECYGGSAYSIR